MEQALETSQFIVIDLLRAATPGLDENDSSIRGHIDDLRRLKSFDQSAMMIVAHARKGGTGDIREHLRGSGAIYDCADAVYFLKADEEATITVQQTKGRFGPTTPTFCFRLQDVGDKGVRLVEVTSPKLQTPEFDNQLLKRVRGTVAHNPGIGIKRLRELVRGRAEKVDAVVAHLVDLGVIERRGRGYFLAGARGDSL